MGFLAMWIVLGLVLCTAEIFIPSFFIFWFGLGAFAAGIVSIFFGFVIQLVIFITVSALLVIFTRPIVLNILLRHESPKKINIDEIIGKKAIVIEHINPLEDTGKVKINGEIWRAMTVDGSSVEIGNYVKIVRVEGTLLKVKKEG
ncbi:NfeD family protein [Mesoaciditoga lauensis]|uniref:NfeD family protein n=1 Tax=Mesoaciditoga lauensis TaxID=1495039 RepID=UPI00056794C8|nr:NfeD family protein [Mesoaciditoga lauensis]